MNRLECEIVKIQVSGSMSLVTLQLDQQLRIKAIVIETPDTAGYLQTGNKIHVLFKETEVVIGIGDVHSTSLQNRIPGTITRIERGILLCRVYMDTAAGVLQSVISTESVSRLQLDKKTRVYAMVKLNEVMLEA